MRYCKANPNCPIDLLVWTSRSYLSSIVHGIPSARQLYEEIGGYGGDALLEPLQQVWDVMLASSQDTVTLHELDCPCLSIHEQALITALRSLQHEDRLGYAAALAVVLPPAAIRMLSIHMHQLSDAMFAIDSEIDSNHSRETAQRPSGRPELRVVH
ncbi:MAG: hypothetical protein AAF385_17145 [Pseudomonadota bacterium]